MSNSLCSMTPPVSPNISQQQQQKDESEFDSATLMEFEDSPLFLEDLDLDFLEDEAGQSQICQPLCFECTGEVFPCKGLKIYSRVSFHEKGIIRSGAIEKMLEENKTLSDPDPVVELFDFKFIYTDLTDKMERLFLFTKSAITGVQNIATYDTTSSILHRKHLINFLVYVNDYIQRGPHDEENTRHKFLQALARNLHLLLVHTGRISDDFTLSSYSLDLQLSSIHHSLHQRLELYWYLLLCYHTLVTSIGPTELPLTMRMAQTSPGEDYEGSIVDQLIAIIFTDLVSLAVPLFNKLSTQEWLRTSPFVCGCLMEFWALLANLVNRRKKKWGTESFWVRLHQVLQRLWDVTNSTTVIDDDELVLESDLFILEVSSRPTNPLGFSLWLTTHLSHIFTFDGSGNHHKPDPVQNCSVIVHMLVNKILRTSPKEDSMRACLRCCLSICSLWPPSTQLITLLWEHFFRKLNDRFQLHLAGIEGLAVISKNSSSLLERCKKWCSSDDSGLEQETSFHLYLQLLACLLTQGDSQSEWRSIKGRFYSKFHQRRMQELTETGLHNLSCLFITLALCVDAEEVASKLMTFFDMLDPTLITSRVRSQVWCGALAMTQLLAKQKKNFSELAEKLASSFDSISKQLSVPYLDYHHRQELSPLITLYIEGVRDVVEHSDLEGSEYMFIGEGIASFLSSCGESDLRYALSALDSIIMRLRSVVLRWKEIQLCTKDNYPPGHKAVAERMWRHVFPFVRDHAQTLTPPLCLADLAVSFTHLALDFPPPYTECSGGIVGVFQQFTADPVSSSIVCHYLSQIIGDTTLRDQVIASPQPTSTTTTATPPTGKVPQLEVKVQQSQVVRCWWHCVMLMQPSSPSLLELTQQVMRLSEVESLLTSDGSDAVDGEMLGAVRWKVFLKAIASAYRKAEGLLKRQRVRNQVLPYFSGVGQQVAPVMRTLGPLETMLNMYRAVGCLVKYCAPLLYLQSKPCPLPDVIKLLVLPASVFTMDKPLHSHFLAAIRETLHMYIDGLSCLDYSRDSFIQRQLRSIVTQYLLRFPLSSWDIYSHPVLRVLRSTSQSSPERTSFRQHFLGLVLEQLRKSSNPAHAEVARQMSFDLSR